MLTAPPPERPELPYHWTRRTPRRRLVVLAALRHGHSRRAAAGEAGMAWCTLLDWYQSDPVLRAEIGKAEADHERNLIGRIVEAAENGVWQAAAWLAERKWPEEYGQRRMVTGTLDARHEHSGPGGGPIEIAAVPARDRVAGRIASIAARIAEGGDSSGSNGSGGG